MPPARTTASPTIARVLDGASRRLAAGGIEHARLEAEVLLAHAMDIDRTHLLARMPEPLPVTARARFSKLLLRRISREPLAYVVARREFYGLDIECAPGALIPRPETEMLVDVAVEEARARDGRLRVVDVGTGSGAIAVAVAFREPLTQVTATDTSKPALAIARRNIARHGVATRVHLCETDLLDGLGAFDVILANLPYVCACDWAGLAPEIRDHEPREALIAGPSGTEAIARLLERAPRHLAPGGVAAIEFGDGQTDDVVALGRASFPEATVSVKKDLAGLDRVLVVRSSGG